jgi:hypothetical protein
MRFVEMTVQQPWATIVEHAGYTLVEVIIQDNSKYKFINSAVPLVGTSRRMECSL